MPLDKSYDPAATEPRLYERWEKTGAFACALTRQEDSGKKPYTIMMPPPNVTGSLHMGHALTFTLQDILVRYQRMKGRDVLWQPGTDHAGIATQMIVERQLAAQKIDRRTLGREKFLEKVWAWKAESGGTITTQLRRLGASCDWSRERFTMDEGLSKAVTHEFVTLFKQGLIKKDKRLVNWDPKMLTAVSDLEVEQRDVKSNMWHFRYPLADNPSEYLVVATTRPETMLGDGAVAVNPGDDRYKHLIGTYVKLPLADRLIPVIGDDHADPEKGSGAVKITAAHDFNDFEVWKRHRHEEVFRKQQDGGLINLFTADAKLNENAPPKYRGLDRYECRKQVIADLEELGLVDKIEPLTHAVPHGDRSGVVIEPWLSEQWYCDVRKMADDAMDVVRAGKTDFVPDAWKNTFFAWLKDIQPWCISRQLWWGHRIPAWYGVKRGEGKEPEEVVFVGESKEEIIQQAQKHYGEKAKIRLVDSQHEALRIAALTMPSYETDPTQFDIPVYQDYDVLDTWFSSALWPFSTLGWPEDSAAMQRYYPTSVLVTGFDIIFFWVARMMMMGIHFTGKTPFEKVYIHALVRDEKGQKMSKTKGNVIDPLDIIDQFGCDALRFTLANLSTPGRDIRLATARIEGNRNFVTKLWNAARFLDMNECVWQADFDPSKVKLAVNKWIIGHLQMAITTIDAQMKDFRFDQASATAYECVWNFYCDWYLEFAKPIFGGADATAKAETRATAAWILEQSLRMLHPIMPYVTEQLWQHITGSADCLMLQAWPEFTGHVIDTAAADEIDRVKTLIEKIRATRVELNVPVVAKIELLVKGADQKTTDLIATNLPLITRMARLKDDKNPIAYVTDIPKGAAQIVLGSVILALPLADIIDFDAERTRLAKESEKLAAEIRKIESKLGNQDFVDRAPPDVVEEQRVRKAEAEAMLQKLMAAQKSLAG